MGSPAAIGIFSTDAQLVIRSWDDWLASATGVAHDDAVGRALSEVLPELESRGLLGRFQETVSVGTVHVLAPALHHYLIACPLRAPSAHFDKMQQRVTIGPLRDQDEIVGVIVAIEDVTDRLDQERELASTLAAGEATGEVSGEVAFVPALRSDNWLLRRAAVQGLASAADASFMKSLVSMLRQEHRDFSLLSSALRLLAVTNVDVTAPLVDLLQDPDPDLRIQAALALGDQHDAAAIPALVAALHDSDQNVRFQAIESLGRLRADAAVDDLMTIVEGGDFFLVFAALDALAAINDPRIAPRLVPLLENENLRVPVADALGSLGDDRTVPSLVAALNQSARAVEPIATALVRIHDRFERQYCDGARIADLVRASAERGAREHVTRAVSTATAEQLSSLVRVMGWFQGSEVEETLTRLLAEPSVRSEVIEALVRHGDHVVDRLIQQLAAEDREVRHAAVVALGRLGNRRATPALVRMLETDRELLVPLAGALARLADRAAFDPLLALLKHPDASVRQSAIGALNSIGHPDLPVHVARFLDDPDPVLRESAVRIAGYFGYRETVDRLFARASDDHESVRRAAIEHLPFLDDPRVLPTLIEALQRETPQPRAAAARALARIDDPAARAALVGALEDDEAWVRYFAARGAAEQRDRGAVESLLVRAERDPAVHVRIAAIDALGEIRARDAMPALKRLAADPHEELSAAALGAIGRIAENGLDELQEAVRAESPGRRTAGVRGLAAHGSAAAVVLLEWTAAADPNPAVARTALEGLASVAAADLPGTRVAIDALITLLSDRERRDVAAAAIAQLPPSRIDDLARGLQHPYPAVRSGTIDALGRFQREEATGHIVHALQDPADSVRESAVHALSRLGARGLEDTFARLASQDVSKAVRRAAGAALARLRT